MIIELIYNNFPPKALLCLLTICLENALNSKLNTLINFLHFVSNGEIKIKKEQFALLEPLHGAAQMRAIHGKNLKLRGLVRAHPHRLLRAFAIGWRGVWIGEFAQACFAFWKIRSAAQINP